MALGQKKKCDLKSKSSTLPSNIPTTQVQPKSVALPTKFHATKVHSKSMLRNSTSSTTVDIQNLSLNDEVAVNMPPTSNNISTPPRTNQSASPSTPNVIRSTPTSPNDLETLEETVDKASIIKKGGRSVARGFEVKKRMKEGKKIGVFIKKSMHLPFGPTEKLFKMEIGIVTRLLAPLRVFYWKNMTDALKKPLLSKIEGEFDIDLNDPHTKEVVEKIMARRFILYKHRCHKHYKKFAAPEEARENSVDHMELKDWKALCAHFKEEKFKELIEENLEENQEESNKELIEMKIYFETHHKSNGTWSHPKARENYEQMNVIWAKALEDGIKITGRQILEKVLKPKSRYVCGLGYGVKPNKSRALELEALLETEKIESEKRNGELIDQIQSQQAKIDNLQDSYDQLKFLIDELRRERGDSENASVSLHED